MILHSELLENCINCENHETDLYFLVTDESTNILKKYPEHKIATKFVDCIDGNLYYDVPFCFKPIERKL